MLSREERGHRVLDNLWSASRARRHQEDTCRTLLRVCRHNELVALSDFELNRAHGNKLIYVCGGHLWIDDVEIRSSEIASPKGTHQVKRVGAENSGSRDRMASQNSGKREGALGNVQLCVFALWLNKADPAAARKLTWWE